MASVTGFVEKVKFRNEDNGYSVLSVVSMVKNIFLWESFII